VKIATGTNLTTTFTNLTRGVEYFFNVTAQDGGLESAFGGEMNYTPPLPPPSTALKPVIILQVQAAPTLSSPWNTIQTIALNANQGAGFFRTKLAVSQ
jgi:hypothetical protein